MRHGRGTRARFILLGLLRAYPKTTGGLGILSKIPSGLSILLKFMEPRLQDSYGRRGCSPQGFVLSIMPTCGSRVVKQEITPFFAITSHKG